MLVILSEQSRGQCFPGGDTQVLTPRPDPRRVSCSDGVD